MKEQEKLYPCAECGKEIKVKDRHTYQNCLEYKLSEALAQLKAMTAERDELKAINVTWKQAYDDVVESYEARIAELEKTSYLPMIPEGKGCMNCALQFADYLAEGDYCTFFKNDKLVWDKDSQPGSYFKHPKCPKPAQKETE